MNIKHNSIADFLDRHMVTPQGRAPLMSSNPGTQMGVDPLSLLTETIYIRKEWLKLKPTDRVMFETDEKTERTRTDVNVSFIYEVKEHDDHTWRLELIEE